MPAIHCTELRQLLAEIFNACKSPKEEARIVADMLVDSTLMGFDSHGVTRVGQYVQDIKNGQIMPGTEISLVKDTKSTAILDCNRNFGQVGCCKGAKLAIEKAKKTGISCVLVRNNYHAGRLGAYTLMMTEAKMLGFAACRGTMSGHWVAPFGGCEGRLSTNPISFAAPKDDYPFVLDMSTSAISEGIVRLLKNAGRQLPPDVVVDAEGCATNNPNDLYGPPRGAILPLGGPLGYKGMGLGMMAEILGGALAGDLINDDAWKGNGVCLVAINIEDFINFEEFKHLLNQMTLYIKSSRPLKDGNGPIIPGEMEFENKRRLEKEGILIDVNLWNGILEIANDLGIQAEKITKTMTVAY